MNGKSNESLIFSVLAALRSLGSALDRLDDVASRRYKLNRTDMRALDIVGQSESITPTLLAEALGMTTGGVTSVIDRLEDSGYVIRIRDHHDRRRMMITRTQMTQTMDLSTFGQFRLRTKKSLETYSSEELQLIHRFLLQLRVGVADTAQQMEVGNKESIAPE